MSVAQLVERWFEGPSVTGSIPVRHTKYLHRGLNMNQQPENCDVCSELLDKDNTFYISAGDPPSKVICYDCHESFARMMEELFSSGKIVSGVDLDKIKKAKVEWFNASVA